ncbi:nucleoside-diphosphate kinase [Parachlamydia sp. AcF125]|uniref:nucleoside-diphosphate kinase n=1 Tax=Parachlamydia sp. AcF125 TaxID=2795736 RepID=UPI001BC9A635|nr:nucleoside-diphosphate kinase [Parachlamydia sp. AcF125]MBS4168630.1 Nucleoside diphosphate kinase [Parachlamydia sp. AcF125]
MYSFICILLTLINTSLFAHQPGASEQQTLSIIKPDAVAAKHIGHILSRFEENGLRIAALKMVKLTKEQAEQFYAVHKDRPFYKDLVEFMSSGPVVVLVLKGENAIAKNRTLMGATDPSKAEKNTLRADFAQSVTKNAVHGSDSVENAQKEISFFFSPSNIY